MFLRKKKTNSLPEVRRLPGQSLRDEKERLLENRFLPLYFTAAFLWVLWGLDEYRLWSHQPPAPKPALCLAIIATGVCVISFRRLFKEFVQLNRGERGELCVAEVLDDLRGHGYRIAHDLKRDGFNVDHVVVGPSGVFAIETKFRSGRGEITVRNGQGLFVDGRPEEKDCLNQAVANAAEVRRMIKKDCDIDDWVGVVVVFVGDWRIRNKWQTTNARVVTADRLVEYIVDQQPRLTRSEITLIAPHLERSAKSG